VASGSRPEDEASWRTAGFMPLLKPFLWAGTMLPGIAWRKTKPPKAGTAEEPSSEPIAFFSRAQSLPVMPKDDMSSVHRSNSVGRDIVTQVRASLGGESPNARSPASDALHPHHHRDKGTPAKGAGARLLERVHELRAREATAKQIAPPKLYGMMIKKAEPVEGFEWTAKFSQQAGPRVNPDVNPRRLRGLERPKNTPVGEEAGGDLRRLVSPPRLRE